MKEEYRYLSEEELDSLIADVEKDGMVKAPVYLKQEILKKAVSDGKGKALSSEKKTAARIQLFVYSAKIIAAAAAAVYCLILMPTSLNRSTVSPEHSIREQRIERDMAEYEKENGGETEGEVREKKSLTIFVNEKSNEWCEKVNEFSNFLIMEEKNYD